MSSIAPQLPVTDAIADVTAAAERLAPLFAARAAQHDRDGSFPFENFADLRRAGLPALNVPVSHGGIGATLLETCQILEILAAGDGSTALGYSMHAQTIGDAREARNWPAAMFDEVCAGAVKRGALINTLASEPELGSPSRGGKPKTTATPICDDNGKVIRWRIDGHKNFCTLSPTLDYMIVSALLLDGSEANARLLVEPAKVTSGTVEVVETWDSLGMRATGSHDVFYRGAEVDASALMSTGPEGAARTSVLNAWFMLTKGAVYLGVAQAGLQVAAQYALERVPTGLGKPIAEVESIRRQLGQAEFLLEQARICVHHVAAQHDRAVQGNFAITTAEVSPQVAVAKVTATNNAIAVMEHCMRVVGGQAMSRGFPLERHFRDVRGGLNHPINDEAAWLLLGKRALDRAGNK